MPVYQFQKLTGTSAGYSGPNLLGIKNAFVAQGFTVRGSGDGGSRHGDIDAATSVPGAQQGDGGEYDCWTVGNTTDGVAGGAANLDSWCWLRSPDGSYDVLLGGPTFVAFQGGRIGLTRSDAAGFVGGATAADTIPALPSGGGDEERWLIGSRANAGSLHTNTTRDIYSTLVFFGDPNTWVFSAVEDNAGTPAYSSAGAGRFAVIYPHPEDPDPFMYVETFNTSTPFDFWDWVAGAWVSAADHGGDAPNVDGDVGSYKVARQPNFHAGSPYLQKGQTDDYIQLGENATFGDLYTDIETGDVYCALFPGQDWLFKWEAGVTHTLAGSPTEFDLFTFTRQPATVSVSYVNRVWRPAGSELVGESMVFWNAGFIRWTTEGSPDPSGAFYSALGDYGDISDYCVEQIR